MYGSVHLKNPCPRIVNSTGILTNFIKNKLFRSAFGITNTRKIENNLFYKHPPKGRAFGALGIRDTKVASGKFLSRNPRKSLLSGNDSCHEISSSWWNGRVLRARASSLSMVGRSMIEMLGVLAIIGVLSAGGIMGYSAAMENYKVNKFIDMIAKATSALPQYFVKRKGGTGYAATEISTTALCKLNMLPSEICNATTANAEHRKGYFGETLTVYVQQSGTGYLGHPTWVAVKNDGSGSYPGILGPATRIAFKWITPEANRSACIKIATSPAWKGLGPITYVLNGSVNYELPLSMANAETICTNRTGQTVFYVYSDGRWAE